MALPGLLIEYLVNGALALVWLAPLLKASGIDILQSGYLPLLALGLYVVGMAVDFSAFLLVYHLKPLVRRCAQQKHGEPGQDPGSVARQVTLMCYVPDLAKELAMRSSRDRIARGAALNALVAMLLEHAAQTHLPTMSLYVWIPIVALLIVMWAVFESLSYGYELRAYRMVSEKHQLGTKPIEVREDVT